MNIKNNKCLKICVAIVALGYLAVTLSQSDIGKNFREKPLELIASLFVIFLITTLTGKAFSKMK